jgi:SAM-dependent methyltransferase
MDPKTQEFYQTRAREWAAAFPYEYSTFLDPFLARLKPGAWILELGCGDARDAARMESKGFIVDATDGTPNMAALAAEKLGRPARVMRFDELDAETEYDAVWAHASIHHQPLTGLADVLGRVARALKPDGIFFANYKLGDGEARDALGRLYNFQPREDLMALYASQDWVVIEAHDYKDSGMDKVMRDWVAITVKKNAS